MDKLSSQKVRDDTEPFREDDFVQPRFRFVGCLLLSLAAIDVLATTVTLRAG